MPSFIEGQETWFITTLCFQPVNLYKPMLSRQSLEAERALAIYYIEQISPSPMSTKPSVCNRKGSRLSWVKMNLCGSVTRITGSLPKLQRMLVCQGQWGRLGKVHQYCKLFFRILNDWVQFVIVSVVSHKLTMCKTEDASFQRTCPGSRRLFANEGFCFTPR